MAKKHSEFAPSAAARWKRCPGSVKRIRQLVQKGKYDPHERSSKFAAEGTAAHQIREDCLRFGFDAYDFEGIKQGADGMVFEVTEEMCNALQPGIDRVREFGGDLFVEVWVNTTEFVGPDQDGDDQGGTIDAAAVVWKKKLIVMSDLKYGDGVAVEAVENDQTRVYLLGLVRWLEAKYPDVDFSEWDFLIIIDQPRHNAGGGEWEIDYEHLMNYGQEVIEATDQARKKNPPIRPSEKACAWCPCAKIEGACPEHEAKNLEVLGLEFIDLDADLDEEPELVDPEGITPKRRSYIIKYIPMLKKWLDKMHSNALEDALRGRPVPGFKAIYGGKRTRKHKDEKKSLAFMKNRGLSDDECYTKNVLSPAQTETKLKLGQGKFPKSLLLEQDPKPVLVPVEDERPPIPVDDEFVNLDDDDFDDI